MICRRIFYNIFSSKTNEAYVLAKQKMFKTLSVQPKYKDSFFYLISLQALGLRDILLDDVLDKKYQKEINKYRRDIAFLLLPYRADLSLKIYGRRDKLFYAAVCSHLGKTDNKIFNHISIYHYFYSPDVYLILSNNSEQIEQLKFLNKYLSKHNLEPLRKLDNSLPILARNLIFDGRLKCRLNYSIETLPLVSVIMTTYNVSDYIEHSLHSLIMQSYPKIEIIVVDDASNDNTVEKIQKIMKKHSNIRLIRLVNNVGTFVAKSIAAKETKGKLITTQDSDDIAHPRKIELQVEPFLKDSNMVVTFSKWIRITDEGKFYARLVYPLTRLNPASALFNKEIVMEKTTLWDNVRIGADSEFNFRLQAIFKNRFKVLSQPLTLSSHRHNSLMNASDTGYSEKGISLQRQGYWESWKNKIWK